MRGFVAVELYHQRVAGSDDVIDRHLDIRHRRERAGNSLEQIVAEWLQRLIARRQQAQQRQPHRVIGEVRVGAEPLRRLGRRQSGQGNRRHAGHLEHPELVEPVWIVVEDAPAEFFGFVLFQVRPGLVRVQRRTPRIGELGIRHVAADSTDAVRAGRAGVPGGAAERADAGNAAGCIDSIGRVFSVDPVGVGLIADRIAIEVGGAQVIKRHQLDQDGVIGTQLRIFIKLAKGSPIESLLEFVLVEKVRLLAVFFPDRFGRFQLGIRFF